MIKIYRFLFKKQAYLLIPLFSLFFFVSESLKAQEIEGPSLIRSIQFVKEVPSLTSQIEKGIFQTPLKTTEIQEVNPKRRTTNQVVPGKGFPKDGDPLLKTQKSKSPTKSYIPEPIRVFEANTSRFTPSDPTGAVGPNHYVAAWNAGFKIYDKQGNLLVDEASLGTLFEGNTEGDPIVLYDAPADRFIITEFEKDNDSGGVNGLNIAICKGPDPVNDGWYVYTAGFETGEFPDYPKYSVWHDGYYITSNITINTDRQGNQSDAIFVMEREKMLQGLTNVGFLGFSLPTLQTNGFFSPQFFNVSSPEAPASGPATVVFLQDDSWSGVTDDHLKLWDVNVDWTTPQNSAISQPRIITVSDFNSVFDGGAFSNLPQPAGPDIDALQGTIMNQAQFRKFPTYNSAVFNFAVNVAPAGQEQAGIRWYEMRQTGDGQPWTVFQEGTYVSPTGNNAFAASMAIDSQGTIGMGYTTVSTSTPVTINYTGRYANDPLGQMSVPEALIRASTGVSASERYADYTHLTVDPVDGKTFWFITEYFNAERKDLISVFKLAPDLANDLQVVSIDTPEEGTLTNTETITVTLRNAGTATQSNFPISYSINNGSVITETFTGTLAFNEFATYTFTQTADLSIMGQRYTISAQTALPTDQNTSNDAVVKAVEHLWQNDLGVTALLKPQSQTRLGSSENITIEITNFGTAPQTNFPVYYEVDNGARVTETFTSTIAAESTANYTFTASEDFSELRPYTISTGTNLVTDSDAANNSITQEIISSYCTPMANCTLANDGITSISLEGTTITTTCTSDGYSDNTDIVFDLDIQSNPYTGQLQAGFENTGYAIFIDLNNNGTFEASELVSNNTIPLANRNTPFELTLPAGVSLGTYRMRLRSKDSEFGGDLLDPCDDIAYGRITDFSVRIFNSLSVEENIFPDGDLVIIETDKNQFQVSLSTTEVRDKMAVTVFSISGQKLAENWIKNEYGSVKYDLDMSYAASGVYIVRIGNSKGGQSKKIIVR
ncbi:GEVED domain-containing protein [Leeuwenhoekiella sp. W20_SRS_FM14]|uniref:GEVED domain-containing protein n=1 Tax=Leeuwenhoekiella sp. W20_SRS_FM14 TaxID=3240270 RepID=UPI003F984B22